MSSAAKTPITGGAKIAITTKYAPCVTNHLYRMNPGRGGYVEVRVGMMYLVHAPQERYGVKGAVGGVLHEIEQQDRENASSRKGEPRFIQQAKSAAGEGNGDDHRADPVQPHGDDRANHQNNGMSAPAPLRNHRQFPLGPE